VWPLESGFFGLASYIPGWIWFGLCNAHFWLKIQQGRQSSALIIMPESFPPTDSREEVVLKVNNGRGNLPHPSATWPREELSITVPARGWHGHSLVQTLMRNIAWWARGHLGFVSSLPAFSLPSPCMYIKTTWQAVGWSQVSGRDSRCHPV
jgi:hypothetical protein